MATSLAKAKEKHQDVGVILANSIGSQVLIELDLRPRFESRVECLLVFIKRDMLNFLGLFRQSDYRLSINLRSL